MAEANGNGFWRSTAIGLLIAIVSSGGGLALGDYRASRAMRDRILALEAKASACQEKANSNEREFDRAIAQIREEMANFHPRPKK